MIWCDVAPAGRSKPAGFDATDPASYHWDTYGAVLAVLAAGMRPYLSLGGRAPGWATHGARARRHLTRPSANEFGLFAQAAGRQFPSVDIWSIWNEPNLYSLAQPAAQARHPAVAVDLPRGCTWPGTPGCAPPATAATRSCSAS